MMHPFEITELRTHQCVAQIVPIDGENCTSWQVGEITIAGDNGEMKTLSGQHRLYDIAILQLSAESRRIDAVTQWWQDADKMVESRDRIFASDIADIASLTNV